MKNVLYIIAFLIGATTMAQTITVNGTPMLVSDDISFPFWLEGGSSISPEVPVSSISVLEFNIVPNNNGNDMVFNQVITVTEWQTVPEGKTWKVESVLMENQNQGFNSNILNNTSYSLNINSSVNISNNELIIDYSVAYLSSNVIPNGGFEIIETGFCYAYHEEPTTSDYFIQIGNGTGSFETTLGHYQLDSVLTYVRAYATNFNGITYGEVMIIEKPENFIGKEDHGGIIFFVEENGVNGKVVTKETSHWYEIDWTNRYDIENMTVNGFSDWVLPNTLELNLVFSNLGSESLIGNVFNIQGPLWSSCDCNCSYQRYGIVSSSSGFTCSAQNTSYFARGIRDF